MPNSEKSVMLMYRESVEAREKVIAHSDSG